MNEPMSDERLREENAELRELFEWQRRYLAEANALWRKIHKTDHDAPDLPTLLKDLLAMVDILNAAAYDYATVVGERDDLLAEVERLKKREPKVCNHCGGTCMVCEGPDLTDTVCPTCKGRGAGWKEGS